MNWIESFPNAIWMNENQNDHEHNSNYNNQHFKNYLLSHNDIFVMVKKALA